MARETVPLDDVAVALARSHRDAFAAAVGSGIARVPEFSESEFHIITGLLLPIWDRLPAENMRVYRFETDDGERVIGRLVTPEALARSIAVSASTGRRRSRTARGLERCSSSAASARSRRRAPDPPRRSSWATHRVELTGFSDGMRRPAEGARPHLARSSPGGCGSSCPPAPTRPGDPRPRCSSAIRSSRVVARAAA